MYDYMVVYVDDAGNQCYVLIPANNEFEAYYIFETKFSYQVIEISRTYEFLRL